MKALYEKIMTAYEEESRKKCIECVSFAVLLTDEEVNFFTENVNAEYRDGTVSEFATPNWAWEINGNELQIEYQNDLQYFVVFGNDKFRVDAIWKSHKSRYPSRWFDRWQDAVNYANEFSNSAVFEFDFIGDYFDNPNFREIKH